MVGLKSQNPSLIPQWISQNNFNRLYISWYCTVYLPTIWGYFAPFWMVKVWPWTCIEYQLLGAWQLDITRYKIWVCLGECAKHPWKGINKGVPVMKICTLQFFRQSCHHIWTTYRLYVNNQLLPSIDVKTLRPICRVRSLRPPQCGQLGSSRIQSLRDVSGTKQFVVSEP